MKPSKKAYTTPPKKKTVVRGSIEHKLMQLHNRIDEAQTSEPKHIDREWVWTLIEDIQKNLFTKLCKEDGLKCNGLWRKYA